MALKYNPKTGEFENVSESRPQVTRPSTYSSSSTRSSSSSDGLSGCLGAIGVLLLKALPYIIIGGLCSLCS